MIVVDNASTDGSVEALVAADGDGPVGADRDQPRLRGRRQPRHRRQRRRSSSSSPTPTWPCTAVRWRRSSRCSTPTPPSPSSGPGSSSPTAPAIRRRAASPRCSTRPATPCSATSSPTNRFTRRYRLGYVDAEDGDRRRLGVGCVLLGPAARPRGAGGIRRVVLHVRRGHRPVLAGPAGRVGGALRARRRRDPSPGALDGPPPLSHARRPSPLGVPLRGPDRAGVAAAGAAGHGGVPGAASRRSCAPGRP